jgi:membrane associated rhomboid family serine protease
MSRFAELLRTTPQCVLFTTAICVVTYSWQVIYEPVISNITMYPRAIIFNHQVYRMITYAFLHGDVFHLAMNMLSFLTLGTFLEKSFGTLWHFATILWSVLLVGSTELLIVFALYFLGDKGSIDGHSLGFSGTLFHLMVVQCQLQSSSSHSVFGLFQVSSKVYPWVLLIGIQLMLPHISFVGHLSGILVGQLHTAGYLKWILPSPRRLRSLDESSILHRTSCNANYVKTPRSDEIFVSTFSSGESSIRMIISTYLCILWTFIKNVAETLKVIIFGRGQEANDNVRLNEADISSLLVGAGDPDDVEEEGDWVGLDKHRKSEQYESEFV